MSGGRALLPLFGLSLSVAAGCGGSDPEPPRLTTPSARVVREVRRYHGRLEPVRKHPVKSPFDTTLLSWAAHGSPVTTGARLAVVDGVPLERKLLVIEASYEEAKGELAVARFERQATVQDGDERLRKAHMRRSRAVVSHQSLLRARDWVGMLRNERDQAVDAKRKARLERELEAQRPQVERGFVSRQELDRLQDEVLQLDLGIRRRKLETDLLKRGPAPEKVVDRALDVAKAEATVRKEEERSKNRAAIAGGPVKRAESAIQEVIEQLEDAREKLAGCVVPAEVSGTFLRNQDSQPWTGGMKLAAGTRIYSEFPIGWIATGGRCRLRFWVHESQLRLMTVGRSVTFHVEADARKVYPATIAAVSRVANYQTEDARRVRWLEVTATIDLPVEEYGAVGPGLNATVELTDVSPEPSLSLPGAALRGDHVELGSGELRPVKIGRVGLEYVEITAGLAPGEQVVLPGRAVGEGTPTAATRGDLVEVFETGGTLSADSQEVLYNNESDDWRTKINWLAEKGTEVTSGALIVKLDAGDFSNKVEEATEELKRAKATREKAVTESRAASESTSEAVRVSRARLAHEKTKLVALEAGADPDETAKAASRLGELQVDEEALAKKLKVTREMASKGFSGRREVEELEERWMRAQGAVDVAQLQFEIAKAGAVQSELELAKLAVDDAAAILAYDQALYLRAIDKGEHERKAAQAGVRAKRENLVRRKAQLEGYDLKTSRSGTVVYLRHREQGKRVPFKVGASARRGAAIAAVADLSKSRIEGLIAEGVAWRVEVGSLAQFWLASFPDEKYRARVRTMGILPQEMPDGEGEQGFEVVLEVLEHSARLQPGVRVRFEVELDRFKDKVLVPLTSVISDQGKDLVLLSDGSRRVVEVLGRDREHAALGSGIEEGEHVLVP